MLHGSKQISVFSTELIIYKPCSSVPLLRPLYVDQDGDLISRYLLTVVDCFLSFQPACFPIHCISHSYLLFSALPL